MFYQICYQYFTVFPTLNDEVRNRPRGWEQRMRGRRAAGVLPVLVTPLDTEGGRGVESILKSPR